MGEKFRSVFLPLMLLVLGFAVLVSLLNWALVIRSGWLSLDENVAAIWLPAGLAMIAVGFLFAPRLHLLAFDPRRGVGGLYVVVAIACVAGPAILVQKYLQASGGEMVTVLNAGAVPLHPDVRYFTIAAPCLDKGRAVPHTRVSTSGDHDEDLNVELTAAVPFCNAPAWLGLVWHDRIDNTLDDKKKDALYRDFVNRDQQSLNTLDPKSIRYYERVGNNSFRRALLKALKDAKIAGSAPVFLIPHDEAFAPRGGAFLGAAAIAFAVIVILWLFMVWMAPLKPLDQRQLSPPGGVMALFIPHRESFGLPLLIDINLLVFCAMVLSGAGFLDFEIDDLIAWGASSGHLDHGIGVLRLITATFVHAGFFHILGNMYGLLIGGVMLTPVARNMRLIIVYLVSGLGGSLLSVAVHPDIVMVGASGAIFGFFGALIALVVLRDPKMLAIRRAILINVGIFMVLNIVYGATTPGVDNFAHIGGFLTGLLCGGVLYILDRNEKQPVPAV